MDSKRLLRAAMAPACAAFVLILGQPALANHSDGTGRSFTTLEAGFTQDVYGVAPHFMGGVAFAPDGDPMVDRCSFSGSPLTRFDSAGTADAHGDELHPFTTLTSDAGCGLTNHVSGSLFTNTSGGARKLDADTGAPTGSPFGPAGNALGIAPDPVTGDLMYVGSGGKIERVNAALDTTSTFSDVTEGDFLDGIYWDPEGNFLFISNRAGGGHRLTILNRAGELVQHVPMGPEPDGIAFHASAPKFVVTMNLEGTMTRFDFPGDDFTQTPTQSEFASGGFRSDLSQVGPDGCLYMTQSGTRYEDDVTDSNNSLVRICGGFARPPGVGAEGPAGDPTCSDRVDNDGDGKIDGADDGCPTTASAQPQQPQQRRTARARRDRSAPRVTVAGVAGRGCVRRAFSAKFRIRESNLRLVSVFLDGKRVARTSKRRFSVRVAANRLKSGRHSLRVVAVDRSGNRRSRTRVFARCAQARPQQRRAPVFTG